MENVKEKIVSPKMKKINYKEELRKVVEFENLSPEEQFDKLLKDLQWITEKLVKTLLDPLERFIFGIVESNTLIEMDEVGQKCRPERPVFDWSLEPEGGLKYV